MAPTYWHKQTKDQPLFSDLIWSRPESRHSAGKLLIIGGNIHSFAAVGQAYQSAIKAGIGTIKILLPDALQKTVSKLLPEADFAASTPSGSFSQLALADFLDQSAWADGVLIAGDLARNSETSILLEKFIAKFNGELTMTKDAVDYFTKMPSKLINRPDTCLVLTLAQLQQIALNLRSSIVFTFDTTLLQLVDKLQQFTIKCKVGLVLKHLDTIFVALDGQISSTKTDLKDEEVWRVKIAAQSAVWWLQNPSKPFESITTSLVNN